jgi:hypothetical protein
MKVASAEDYFVFATSLNIVIPGCTEGAGPESITTTWEYGFRVRASRAPE